MRDNVVGRKWKLLTDGGFSLPSPLEELGGVELAEDCAYDDLVRLDLFRRDDGKVIFEGLNFYIGSEAQPEEAEEEEEEEEISSPTEPETIDVPETKDLKGDNIVSIEAPLGQIDIMTETASIDVDVREDIIKIRVGSF